MAELWETIYLNDPTLSHLCETPKELRLPVGSCVHVRKNKGYLINGLWYRALPGYVLERNISVLNTIAEGLNGWELVMDEKPLSMSEWRRGWVDQYYPLSSHPVYKCALPGMYRVQLKLVDKDIAKLSLDIHKSVPACPTCTLEQYEDKDTRVVFDQAMRYFIHFWLYGGAYDPHDRGEGEM